MRLILEGAETPRGTVDIFIANGRVAAISSCVKEVRGDISSSGSAVVDENSSALIDNDVLPGTEHPRQFAADRIIDCRGKIVLPGFIDPHVHMRDMNLARKETFLSASLAALAGGVTSVMDMPNSSPAADTIEGLLAKKDAALSCRVNYGFYAGVAPGKVDTLAAILEQRRRYNVGAVKFFFAASSANEVLESDAEIEKVLSLCVAHALPCVVHCEKQSMIRDTAGCTAADHHRVRPVEAALAALRQLIPLQKKTGAFVSIAHVSTAAELELIREAKRDGAALFCEATPHHLFLNASACRSSGNYAKINPPLREEEDRLAMIEALCDNTVDYIGTDHSPHTLDEKNLDYRQAPSGFPGLETGTHLLIDFMLKNAIPLERMSGLLSERAARIFGLDDRGVLKKDAIADLVIIDPEQNYTVCPDHFYSRAHYSPFSGLQLTGRVVTTIVNGIPLYDAGKMLEADNHTPKGAELFNAETGVNTTPA